MAKASQLEPKTLDELNAKVQIMEVTLEQIRAFMTKMENCFDGITKALFGVDSNNPGAITQIKLNASEIKRLNGSISKLENAAQQIDLALDRIKEIAVKKKPDDDSNITFKYVLDKFAAPIITALLVWFILEGIPAIQAAAGK